MRSVLIALMLTLVTALSMLAAATPGLGKSGSNGKSGNHSAHSDDDDDGGAPQDSDDDDDGADEDSDDDDGSGKKADAKGSKNREDRKGSKSKDDRKGSKKEKDKRGRSGKRKGSDEDDEQDDPSSAEDGAPPSSTPGSLPPAFDPNAPLRPDASGSPSDGSSRSGSVARNSPPSPPSVGQRVNVAPQGQVLVKLPSGAGFVPLDGAASLPNGSLVDARLGSITLTSASDRSGGTQTATFRGDVFGIHQDSGPRPVTELRLTGDEGLISCELRRARRRMTSPARGSRAPLRVSHHQRLGTTTTAARRRRGLWGRGKGRFRTRGRHGAASVRGTRWLTEDRCEGTFFTVTRGVVTVEDFAKDRTVTLRAGDSYLARSRR